MLKNVEQRRRLHGLKNPLEPGDPNVMARQNLHEAAIKWQLKWATPIQFISGVIAFSIVLLPTILSSWKSVIENLRPLAIIHQEFTRLSAWLILPLVFGLCLSFYSASKKDGKKFSHHGYPINIGGFGPQQIIDMDLYPRTKLEERIFWADFIGGIFLFGWWFWLFGGFSIVLKNMR